MTAIGILIAMGIAIMCSGFAYDIVDYCINQHKKKDCEKLDKYEDYIVGHMDYNRGVAVNGIGNTNNQVVYKVDGNFNGNITGDNVTVILMGNGNINGNINARDGEVVLIKGDVKGNVKANKVICPSLSNTHTQVNAKCSECEFVKRQEFISLHGNYECYKCNKFNESFDDDRPACQEFKYRNTAKDVKSPELPTKNANKTCIDNCSHLRFGLSTVELMVCNATNKSIDRFALCENYERRYKRNTNCTRGDDMDKYYMDEYYLKISCHNSKCLQCLILATESFSKIIQRDNIWEKMLDDDDLILQLRYVFNSLFTAYCILSEDYTDPNYMNIKMEVDDFIIVREDERLVFDNGETVYISLNPYNYGKWYSV